MTSCQRKNKVPPKEGLNEAERKNSRPRSKPQFLSVDPKTLSSQPLSQPYNSHFVQAVLTMVQAISYNTISHVIETWEQLRRMKNYEEVAGVKLFQK